MNYVNKFHMTEEDGTRLTLGDVRGEIVIRINPSTGSPTATWSTTHEGSKYNVTLSMIQIQNALSTMQKAVNVARQERRMKEYSELDLDL